MENAQKIVRNLSNSLAKLDVLNSVNSFLMDQYKKFNDENESNHSIKIFIS